MEKGDFLREMISKMVISKRMAEMTEIEWYRQVIAKLTDKIEWYSYHSIEAGSIAIA